MSLEIYKKIELEKELKRLVLEGKSREEATSLLVREDDLIDANYIIEAYLMPIDEITEEINRYDNSSPKLDEVKFVDGLCEKYNVDRKAVIERIRNVRTINKHNSLDNEKKLQRLKLKREELQAKKNKLNDKSMDIEERSMYYFGLGLVTILGGVLFYSNPVVVGIIPVVYATSIPKIRLLSLYKKEIKLVDELVNLGKEIDCLEETIEKDKIKENKQNVVENRSEYTFETPVYSYEEELNKSVEGPTLVKRRKNN